MNKLIYDEKGECVGSAKANFYDEIVIANRIGSCLEHDLRDSPICEHAILSALVENGIPVDGKNIKNAVEYLVNSIVDFVDNSETCEGVVRTLKGENISNEEVSVNYITHKG